jgi:multisubunit Na+/H+ antiporter MnhC subunit
VRTAGNTVGTDAKLQRARRILPVLVLTAVVVSIVHYTDNFANYDDYPHGNGPEPSAGVVLAAWFVLTPFGLAGWWLYMRGEIRRAAMLLIVYSTSGLVGIGHYTVAGMTDEPAWRQAHVVADIVLGSGMFAFALWSIVALPKTYRTLTAR